MPRTASFDLSEVKATSPKIPQPKYRSNLNSHAVSQPAPQQLNPKGEKCCHCSCGWTVGLFFSACSIAFLTLFFLFPEQFVSRFIIIEREHHLLVQKGYLRVYPNLPHHNVEPSKQVPGTYVIDPSDETEIMHSIEDVLRKYTSIVSDVYPPNPYVLCWLDNPLRPEKPCYFDKNWILKECTKENHYGYKTNQGLYNPCVLLRLEETEDWSPQIYNREDVSETWILQYDASHIAVGCYPSVVQDRRYRELNITVHPNKGFPIHFFPQTSFHEKLYRPPMVMVQFPNLEVGRDYSIECWIYAQNSWLLKDSGVVQIHFHYDSNRNTTSGETSDSEAYMGGVSEINNDSAILKFTGKSLKNDSAILKFINHGKFNKSKHFSEPLEQS